MNHDTLGDRLISLSGSPFDVGRQMGTHLQSTLAGYIHYYLKNGPLKFGSLDLESLQHGAMGWFDALPGRFQEEIRGIAAGSGVSLQQLAEWGYADAGSPARCSAFILSTPGGPWIGRNNDLWTPDLWGYAIHRHIPGRLSTLIFGMRGEIFAATGINQTGLWLHYNWLPVFDTPKADAWTPYVLMTEMLETCQTIDQVEAVLKSTTRTGGMLIFALQNQNGVATGALLECTCQQVARMNLQEGFLAGTNHYLVLPTPHPACDYAPQSVQRLAAMQEHLANLSKSPEVRDLIAILANPQVEQHREDYGTVYANLYNPTRKAIWFTFGGYPAASQGQWQQIPWPFT